MLLDEQTGCLLKFSGELEDVSREDFHDLFAGHGKIKWVDFTRGAKEVTTRKKKQSITQVSSSGSKGVTRFKRSVFDFC